MNFIFISPHFPASYWEFCAGLKRDNVTVLGIADAPYESLDIRLRNVLTEYYRVNSLENYDAVYRAVAFFAYKYGRIDWIESNNEYWLEQDARLRTDFNVHTGLHTDNVEFIKEKSLMKKIYQNAGIPTARQLKVAEGPEAAHAFAAKVGYPLIIKPDIGVGAGGTHKIHNEEDFRRFLKETPDADHYVIEEFVSGDICSYDAVINSKGLPLFESMTVWPPSIMDIVNKQLDLSYYVDKTMPEALRSLGRRTVKAFNVTRRFVHLEFFRLDKDHPGLGNKGDFVALEVNMRPAGGYTPDMMNYAHSTDVYKIWADMVAFDESRTPPGEEFYCAYASRRDNHHYVHTSQEVLDRYGRYMVMHDRMPEILSAAMGNELFTAKFSTMQEVEDFINFIHLKAETYSYGNKYWKSNE